MCEDQQVSEGPTEETSRQGHQQTLCEFADIADPQFDIQESRVQEVQKVLMPSRQSIKSMYVHGDEVMQVRPVNPADYPEHSRLSEAPELRASVVDWFVGLVGTYQCQPQTLFKAVYLMDRFLKRAVEYPSPVR